MAEAGSAASERLADLGEWQLIERLARFAPAGQFNDDAAVLQAGTTPLVINTDVLVEGVHFSESTTNAWQVGWGAAAANLSDLAAMGCPQALGITVGLVAPANTPWAWVEGVYQGLQSCLERHGGVLLGGDCSSGNQRLLAVTALGHLAATDGGAPTAIRRSDGCPGDWLVSSGPHGLSRLGLALLQGTCAEAAALPQALQQAAIQAHQQPRPRFDAVLALQRSQPPGATWRVAGSDSSDGLAPAAAAIAVASGCRAVLKHHGLPLVPAMEALAQAERWCLAGGEDFELVLALEPAWAAALIEQLPGSRQIGVLTEPGSGESLGWDVPHERFPKEAMGFCHFRP